jgi:hypothetical protein
MFKFEFVCLALTLAIVHSAVISKNPSTSTPSTFIQNPSYTTYRDTIATQNRKLIADTNPTLTIFQLAENQFITLTDSEFNSLYLLSTPPSTTGTVTTYNTTGNFSYTNTQTSYYIPGGLLNIDWTLSGKVTPVKDQGRCSGSGWAFAAVSDL